MTSQGFGRAAREEVELWEPGPNVSSTIAWTVLHNGLITFSPDDDTIDSYIAVIGGDLPSLFDDEETAEMMERLPVVEMYTVIREGLSLEGKDYEGLECTGMAATQSDKDTVEITSLFKFESAEAATALSSQIEQDIKTNEESKPENVQLSQDGAFIVVTMERDISAEG